MSWLLEFFVPGIPRTQGSKTAFPYKTVDPKTGEPAIGVRIVDAAGPKGAQWKADVRMCAVDAMNRARLTMLPKRTPVHMELVFYMPRPKKHYRTGKHAALLRDDAPTLHIVKPDQTKLLRSVEDAMTGVVYKDDSQVCAGIVKKKYPFDRHHKPGVLVFVRPCGEGSQ